MGVCESSLIPSELSILTSPECHKNFDFNSNNFILYSHELTFPSYLNNRNGKIEYSSTRRPDIEEYELLKERDTVVLRASHKNSKPIERLLEKQSSHHLRQNDHFKLGEVFFFVRTICTSYDDQAATREMFASNNLENSRTSAQFRQSGPLGLIFPLASSRLIGTGEDSRMSQQDDKNHCRVCFNAIDSETNPLLSLCKCMGSIQFIHYECLRRWIKSKAKIKLTSSCEYYEYKNACDLCKEILPITIVHNNKTMRLFQQTSINPPYAILARQDGSKLLQYVIPLEEGKKIGLGRKNCIVQINHPSVNTQHAQLIFEDNKLFLISLESNMSTAVSLSGQIQIAANDKLSLSIGTQAIRMESSLGGNCIGSQTGNYTLRYERI